MNDVLESDASAVDRTEAVLETPAVADRRRLVRELLELDRGEDVLAIGCGPGLELAALADAVAPAGRVHGIDRNGTMVERTVHRCADHPNVTATHGDAVDVPLADEAFDAVVAVQVYEYVDDVPAALDELARVLRPGGRAVVCDTDIESLVWRSPNDERMERVREGFADQCARPRLGSELAPLVRAAGLAVERVEPHAILNTRLAEDRFVYSLMRARAASMVERGRMEPREARAWMQDLRDLEADGGTFFSLTQYCYLVRKPEPKPESELEPE